MGWGNFGNLGPEGACNLAAACHLRRGRRGAEDAQRRPTKRHSGRVWWAALRAAVGSVRLCARAPSDCLGARARRRTLTPAGGRTAAGPPELAAPRGPTTTSRAHGASMLGGTGRGTGPPSDGRVRVPVRSEHHRIAWVLVRAATHARSPRTARPSRPSTPVDFRCPLSLRVLCASAPSAFGTRGNRSATAAWKGTSRSSRSPGPSGGRQTTASRRPDRPLQDR